VHILLTSLSMRGYFATMRVTSHRTQGDCWYILFYSNHDRKPYFALICRFQWQWDMHCLLTQCRRPIFILN